MVCLQGEGDGALKMEQAVPTTGVPDRVACLCVCASEAEDGGGRGCWRPAFPVGEEAGARPGFQPGTQTGASDPWWFLPFCPAHTALLSWSPAQGLLPGVIRAGRTRRSSAVAAGGELRPLMQGAGGASQGSRALASARQRTGGLIGSAQGSPGGSLKDGKDSACNAAGPGLSLWVGRSYGKGVAIPPSFA